MPHLETLDLDHALPIVSETTKTLPSPSHVISLPRLSQIHLVSSVLETANLFNHIDFPSTATMQLILDGTKGTGTDFSSLIPTISKSRTFASDSALTGAPFKALSLTSPYHTNIHFAAYTATSIFASPVENYHAGSRIAPFVAIRLVWHERASRADHLPSFTTCPTPSPPSV